MTADLPGARPCPDCGVQPDKPHERGCDVARCTACGEQQLTCPHDADMQVWTGTWPCARPAEQRRPGLVPDTLAGFLRDRLDEDEQAARAAGGRAWEAWQTATRRPWVHETEGDNVALGDGNRAALHVQHIARHDPARVLAEVAAKRRLLRKYEASLAARDLGLPAGQVDALEFAVKLAVLPYAGHPDYRQEWAP